MIGRCKRRPRLRCQLLVERSERNSITLGETCHRTALADAQGRLAVYQDLNCPMTEVVLSASKMPPLSSVSLADRKNLGLKQVLAEVFRVERE